MLIVMCYDKCAGVARKGDRTLLLGRVAREGDRTAQ
jgi:hypothetical protein